jgi:Reverse transcriptase (RNA-dependent DNA polymerase)
VAKLTTYHVIFALPALKQWEVYGMVVITTYLLGKLDEEIYVQPEVFIRMEMKRNTVCRLLQSLYGLKQAAHVSNLKIHAFPVKLGFVRSSADPCLYIDIKLCIYITIWVDNLLIASREGRNIAKFKGQLATEFEIKDLGYLEHFLGMTIMRGPNGDVSIDENGYIHQILERFDMESSKSVLIPIAAGSCLTPNDNSTQADIKQY